MERNLIQWMGYLLAEFLPQFVQGTAITLATAGLGTLLGFLLGFLLGVVQSAPINRDESVVKVALYRLMKALAAVFIELFRCTPLMVQAMVIFYGLKSSGVNISSFNAAILVILLNTGAYMAETVRGGIISIDTGQQEGGTALGMTHLQTMFSVVLPQAFRNIIPEMGNLFLTNLKMTSVLNVIGIAELYFVTKTVANTYYKYFESFLLVGLIYFVLCFAFTKLIAFLEKKLDNKSYYELATEFIEE